MKLKFKKASLLITGIMVGGNLLAQTPDSTMSKDYVKPFSDGSAYRTWSIGINGGVLTPYTIFGINKQDFHSPHEELGYGGFIKYQILPSFGLQANYLGGYVSGAVTDADETNGTYTKFRTKLNYAVDISGTFTLANINWMHNRSFIQPYVTLGGGVAGYTNAVTFSGAKTPNNDQHEFYMPVGAGFKINLSKGINLDLGYQMNFVNADDFDGVVIGSTNDRFSYGHIGLEFALGKRSKPQLAAHNPVSSMRTEYMWENRNTRNQLQGQIDAEKAKNDQLRNDLNTTNANLAKLTADSDGDGVPDVYDKCPNTQAGVKVDGSGCPLPKADVKVYVTEEDKKVVKDAIKNLEFDFGKATIRAHSFPSLDKVAQLLVNKNFSLKLAGHTDNVGSDAANMKLSKERAESIKTYLVGKGANASRIEATGYGETQPIATNKTAAGRQQNRRVEFTLY